MAEAVVYDRNYAPRLTSTYKLQPSGVWLLQSTNIRAARKTKMSKPKTKINPIINGWRNPSSYVFSHDDLASWLDNFILITYRTDTRVTTKMVGLWTTSSLTGPRIPYAPAWLQAQCEIKALLKMKDGKVDMGVSIGERKEAAGMMLANFSKIAKAYRSVRKGDFKGASRALGVDPSQGVRSARTVPERWLEYQYGWKPLLGDVYTVCEEIAKHDYQDPTRKYFHVKDTESREDVLVDQVGYGHVGVEKHSRAFQSVKVRFDFSPNPDYDTFRTLDEWGLTNPALVGWEFLPGSFIVDWALPVGDFLSAFTSRIPYGFKSGSKTLYSHSQCDHFPWPTVDGASRCVMVDGMGRSRSVRMNRSLYSSFPFPDIRALTHLHNGSKDAETIATRVANAISILALAFK